jgi:hypothetical protein
MCRMRYGDWYAEAAVRDGWSRNVLLNMITTGLHNRAGAAPSNFTAQLPAADSELAQQVTRDPYVLDFLDLTGPAAERLTAVGEGRRVADPAAFPRAGHDDDCRCRGWPSRSPGGRRTTTSSCASARTS